jgi:hypothetical protein
MATWDYRIVQENGVFTIREAYYSGERVSACAERGMMPFGADREELYRDWLLFGEAFAKPVVRIEKGKVQK